MENQNQNHEISAFAEIKEIISALSWKERFVLLAQMIGGCALLYTFIWIMLAL